MSNEFFEGAYYYYLALRRTQKTIHKGKQNFEHWLAFFLKTMVKQKNNMSAIACLQRCRLIRTLR